MIMTIEISSLNKAKKFFLSALSSDQKKEYLASSFFHVKGKNDRIYRIEHDVVVRESDGARFCAILPDTPLYDQLLAKKLYLENNSEEFFKVANWLNQPLQYTYNNTLEDNLFQTMMTYICTRLSYYNLNADDFELECSPDPSRYAYRFILTNRKTNKSVKGSLVTPFLLSNFYEILNYPLQDISRELVYLIVKENNE